MLILATSVEASAETGENCSNKVAAAAAKIVFMINPSCPHSRCLVRHNGREATAILIILI
jgi:hypothetical protein